MSERAFERCKTCQEFAWFPLHKCAPVWEARIFSKFSEDWTEVHAHSAETAATKFAEQYDYYGDYDIVRRGSEEVEVRKQGEKAITLMGISAESVPHYSASPLPSPARPAQSIPK